LVEGRGEDVHGHLEVVGPFLAMSSLTHLAGLRDRGLAVDLGTTNTLVYVPGRGIVLAEPSLVAVTTGTRDVRAVGVDAERLVEREAGSIVEVRPVRGGVISELELATKMLERFRLKVCRRRGAHPRMVVAVPSGATGVARRAVEAACRSVGAGEVHLIEEPMAAAIGAGLPVDQAVGSLVVDIGGGTTEVALISVGAIVASRSIPVGGDEFDESIVKHLRGEHGLVISQPTAERVKREIGSAFPNGEDARIEVSGRDAYSTTPKTVAVTSEEIRRALERHVAKIVEAVKDTLSRTPPELSADVLERGAVLAGGGALLMGLEERLRRETQLPAQAAELPLTCVAVGSGKWLEELNDGRFQEVIES
jgi:rod shape-determining protein MreB